MTSEHDANLWNETIRQAFAIPDGIADRHMNEIIARKVLRALPPPAPETDSAGGVLPALAESFTGWVEAAELVVIAFVTAANEGKLDLALCGFGEVTESKQDVPEAAKLIEVAGQKLWQTSPGDTAVGVVKPGPAVSRVEAQWIRWLFAEFSRYVKAAPYD
jgi:hypothetical protein